jgi:RimJ/RimL family protein N-acetyltransferase
MKDKNLLSASLLKVGGKLASAQVFVENRGEMLLSISAMSPFFANMSPSKIHTYFVWKDFAEKGIEIFDLSPGGGYKNRFATDCEEVFSLTIFNDKKEFLRYKYERKMISFAKESLEKAKLTKTKVFAFADKLSHKIKRVKRRTIPKTILKNVRNKVYELKEVRVYMMPVSEISKLPNHHLLRQNSIEDLLKYSPNEGWQFTTSEFHQVCLQRFAEGNHSFTISDEEKLLHYGWLVENQEISNVFEVAQELELPPNSSVLYDFYTHLEARGQGLYQKSLYQILHQIADKGAAKQVFISVLADNFPSKNVIEKVGFTYQGSLFQETKFGRLKRWRDFSNF